MKQLGYQTKHIKFDAYPSLLGESTIWNILTIVE